MRILVVFTGGTIGSVVSGETIGLDVRQKRLLLQLYMERPGHHEVDFEVVEPLHILSENAKPEDWDSIVGAVHEAAHGSLAGVIVTHGTDTLAFAAAASSLALSDVGVPVVFVASNLPLGDKSSNGLDNFHNAVSLIAQAPEPGVFVTYTNPDGRNWVHYGSRLAGATPLDHYFRSVARAEFGEFVGDQLLVGTRSPAPTGVARATGVTGTFGEHSGEVLIITPYPGLDYEKISLAGIRAVVHDLYHSGTACMHPGRQELSLLVLARRCKDAGIPLFVVPWPSGSTLYESSRELYESGVITIARMAVSAAYAKVLLGLSAGLDGAGLRSYVADTEVAHEFIPLHV